MDYDSRYEHVFKYKIKNIISLNIDNLLEVLFCRDLRNQTLIDSKLYGITENANTMLLKIQGSFTYPADDDYYFTSEEVISYNLDNPQMFQILSLKIASYPTLFWGVNIDNIVVQNFINNTRRIKNIQPRGKWIVLLPDVEYDDYAQDLRDDGYYIIRSTTDELLEYFSKIKKTAKIIIKHKKNIEIENPFDKYLIKSIKKARNPVRPISYFYEGGDALWSDIISNKIEKLSYYYDLISDIEKGYSRHISGIPGSGKTTLLMQLACNISTTKNVYFFDSLQKNIAEQLSNYLEDKICYVFIDNAADNLDSIDVLE